MSYSRGGVDRAHHLHHAPILMTENVAMQHVRAGVIHKFTQHFEIAAWRNGEVVPPDPRCRELDRRRSCRGLDLGHLEGIDMDMERMCRTAVIVERPLLGSSQLHRLIEVMILKFLAVDRL